MIGDRNELDAQLEELYGCLRELAGRWLARERPGHTLQPTALVHEAWLRLADADPASWPDRAQFAAACARTLRRVLVDHARTRGAQKRGEGQGRVTLVDLVGGEGEQLVDVLDIDACLERLAGDHPRPARVVELRFFAGLSIAEVAQLLEVSPRTVDSDWQFARAHLIRDLGSEA